MGQFFISYRWVGGTAAQPSLLTPPETQVSARLYLRKLVNVGFVPPQDVLSQLESRFLKKRGLRNADYWVIMSYPRIVY